MHEHEHDHEPEHIPPPDLPRHKRILGLKPAHFAGALFLIVILLVYLLLLAREGV
jgi:hypothetical protein